MAELVACSASGNLLLVSLRVEVFPVEPDRWIAVIDAPRGAFSTETLTAAGVEDEVRASIAAVLGIPEPVFDLVDDLDQPWSPASAPAQLDRLQVDYSPGWKRKRTWRQRLFGARTPWFGECPACGHDWREHVPSEGERSECRYEIEHEEEGAPTAACRVVPPPDARVVRSDRGQAE